MTDTTTRYSDDRLRRLRDDLEALFPLTKLDHEIIIEVRNRGDALDLSQASLIRRAHFDMFRLIAESKLALDQLLTDNAALKGQLEAEEAGRAAIYESLLEERKKYVQLKADNAALLEWKQLHSGEVQSLTNEVLQLTESRDEQFQRAEKLEIELEQVKAERDKIYIDAKDLSMMLSIIIYKHNRARLHGKDINNASELVTRKGYQSVLREHDKALTATAEEA